MNPYRNFFSFLISTCICFCINISSNYAQSNVVPNQINYQAIAHSSNGQTLNNEAIDVLVGIYAQSPSGTLVYQEEHSTTTNDYGLFTLLIGDGLVTAAGTLSSFSNVEWQNDVYFLNIQIDVGFGFEDLGTQQLVTVPYAFHARTVEFDNVNDLDSDPTNEIQSLSISNNTLFLTQSNDSVTIPVSSYSSGQGIDITNGIISNSGDNDNDSLNEIELPASANNNDILTWFNGQWLALPKKIDADNDGWPLSMDLDDNDNSITFYDNDNNSQNELQQLSLNGNNLILSLTNDTIILPFITYSAGSGIVISSGTITNTGDTSNTNELISSVSFNPSSNEIEIIDGSPGNVQTIDLSSLDNPGTDNQNLQGSLNGTNLTIDIDNGTSATVDLGSLQDGTGTDNQNLQGSLSGTNLTIDIDNGTAATVDLGSLQDGTGTDNQNLQGSLNGTNLTIDIDNGTAATVDLGTLQDGTGTDNQNLTGATLSGNTLVIDIENGNSANVDLSPLNNSGTDNQNLSGSLNGTNITIDIDNGTSATVDLGSLQDGTGSDDQNLTNATLNGTDLTIEIEDGSAVTVDLSNLGNQTISYTLVNSILVLNISGGNSISIDMSAFIELPQIGNNLNDVLTWNGSQWVAQAILQSDNQNISGSSFNSSSNELTIGIEDGNSETVDLSALDVDIFPGNGIDITGSVGSFTIENTGDTDPTDDVTSTVTPADGQILVYDGSQSSWVPQNITNDQDWNTSNSGVIYNETENVGVGLTNPLNKFHVMDNSYSSTYIKDIASFETNRQYATVSTNTTNSGEGGGVFLGKYNNNIVSYVGGNYQPSSSDTSAFFGIGTPENSHSNPELGFRINGTNKSANLSIDDIRIGMESDLPGGINHIKISSNEISLVGNDIGAGNLLPTNLLIKGQMIYDDGNQQSGYILQSDGSGTASWADPSSIANDNDWVLNGSDIYNANSGNIGIGTNNPDDKLHIHDPGNTQVKIESSVNGLASLELDAANTKASVDFYNNGTWAGTMGFDVDDNFLFWQEDGYGKILTGKDGKIGIGTSSPSSKFHVEDGAVLFDGTSGSTPTSGNGRRFMWIPNKQAIRAGSVIGTEWDNANIGIGSAAFGQNNTASGSNSTSFGQANSATGARSLAGGVSSEASGNGSTALGEYASAEGRAEFSVGAYPEISGSVSSFDVMFEVGNGTSSVRNNAFVVNYDGSVGIGTTSTDAFLEIDVDNDWNNMYGQRINFYDNDENGSMHGLHVDVDRDSYGSTYGVFSSVDNDGTGSYNTIGVYGYADGTNSGVKYGVFGSTGLFSSGTRYGIYCVGNGSYTGTWTQTSDVKFKENIKKYEGALEDLMKLQTKTYYFKNNSEYAHMNFSKKLQHGLIAQEVEEIFPELVENGVHPGKFNEKTNSEGEPIKYKAMNYIGLIPVLIQSIQEQQEMIEELKKEIENLKSK